MSSDLFALAALADELNDTLKGARIDKIQQPEADELRFFVRTQGKNLCLCVSCNAGAPRIHLTSSKKTGPQTAPTLCMLLRKHLNCASIESISIFNNDRILKIAFNARTEMRDNAEFFLFAEIMNRYSNIVFTDADFIILDAVKHLPLDVSREHVVLRGIKYEAVKQPKRSFLSDCSPIFDTFAGGDLHKYILDNVSGFSGLSASELLSRAGIPSQTEALSDEEKKRMENALFEFRNIRDQNFYSPCIINGKDVFPFPYGILDGKTESYQTMSDAFDALYTVCDAEIRNKARLKNLTAAAKRLRLKAEKNISNDEDRLNECEEMEKYRVCGELIVSNIYKIKKGDTQLNCVNYYDGSEMTIALDERLSPSKNSAAYYTKYSKLKRTKEFVSKKIIQDRLLLSYVQSIEEELRNLPFDASASAIEEELASLNAFKRKAAKGKQRKEKAEPPAEYLCEGFTILCGRNNMQNDELTFKIASSSDMWLHLKGGHGKHTVILTRGREIPDNVLKIAGEITAASKSAPCEVDYTLRRNVKRQPNGHPGQVIYVNYKTMVSRPDEHKELAVEH